MKISPFSPQAHYRVTAAATAARIVMMVTGALMGVLVIITNAIWVGFALGGVFFASLLVVLRSAKTSWLTQLFVGLAIAAMLVGLLVSTI